MADVATRKEIYFILLKEKVGIVILNSYFRFNAFYNVAWSNTFDAAKGSLFQLVWADDDLQNNEASVNLVSVENSEHFLRNCNLSDLQQLSDYDYRILLAVPSDRSRYNLIMTRHQLKLACSAKSGDSVTVLNDHDCGEIRGHIMYIGSLKNNANDGVYFGVLFDKPAGNSNGCIEGHCYFEANINHAVFISAHNIRFLDKTLKYIKLLNSQYFERECKPENFFEGEEHYNDTRIDLGEPIDNNLDIIPGVKIELTIQSKKHYGIVLWKGKIERFPNCNFVGVELENEISGCSDGTLFGVKYFHSTENKAFFVKEHQCMLDSRENKTEELEVQENSVSKIIERPNIHDF